MALEFEFPSHFPAAARALVSRLLVLDPSQRIGADEEGNATKYDDIAGHEFFEGITWDDPPLHEQKPPPVTKLIPKSSSRASHREEGEGKGGTEEGEGNGEEEEQGRAKDGEVPVTNRSLAHVLQANEQVVHTSIVSKRKGLFGTKRRLLILTDTPRLLYLHPDSLEIKGEIPWSSELTTVLKGKREFVVRVPGRDYVLEDPHNSADQWADAILEMQTRQLRLQGGSDT